MAGESARTYAQRQRDKAARLNRSADLWERGADGEEQTGQVLDGLRAAGWVVLHDQPWPGRPRANIDHVAIGPPGVFVIDSKNWTGAVTVTAGVLRQNGRSRVRHVEGVRTAAAALHGVLRGEVPTYGVLCLTRDEWLLERIEGVTVCSTMNVAAVLQGSPPVLDAHAVPAVAARLAAHPAAHSGVRRPAVRVPRPRPVAPRRRPRPLVGGLKALVVLGVVSLFLFRPGIAGSLAEGIADRLTGVFVSDLTTPVEPVKDEKRGERPRKGKPAEPGKKQVEKRT